MRDDWWHVIVAMPLFFVIAIPVYLALGGSNKYFIAVQMLLALLYPVAMGGDAKYLKEVEADWVPNYWIAIGLGVLVLLSMGVLSIIVSPVYMLKRRGS